LDKITKNVWVLKLNAYIKLQPVAYCTYNDVYSWIAVGSNG